MKAVLCILLGLVALSIAIDTEINFNFAGMIPEGGSNDDCDECPEPVPCPVCPEEPVTVWSDPQPFTVSMTNTTTVGSYTGRTYVTYMEDDMMPEVIGFEFSQDFFTTPMAFATMFMLPESDINEMHPYYGMMVGYNPNGHQPATFATAHFDIHYYMIPEEELMTIAPGSCNGTGSVTCDAAAAAAIKPNANYMPPKYVAQSNVVPYQGIHWWDPAILNQTFEMVWVTGSYDGEVAFHEPMITKAYIMSGIEVCKPIPQPMLYPDTSCFPTKYCIRQDSESVHFTLENFVARVATPYPM